MAAGIAGALLFGRRIYNRDNHPEPHSFRDDVFCGGSAGDSGNLPAVRGGQHSPFEAAAEEQEILLSDKAFCQCVRHDLPDEAECSGAGEYLHLEYYGAGDGLHYHLHDAWDGGYYQESLPGGFHALSGRKVGGTGRRDGGGSPSAEGMGNAGDQRMDLHISGISGGARGGRVFR